MNWHDTIRYLREHPEDVARYRQACYDAAAWPKGAIGEHRARLEAHGESFREDGRPSSIDLCRLGIGFCSSLREKAYTNAERFLAEVEQYAYWGACMHMYTLPHDPRDTVVESYGIYRRIVYRLIRDLRIGRQRWTCADADELDLGAYWRKAPQYDDWRWCEEPDFAWRYADITSSHDPAGE